MTSLAELSPAEWDAALAASGQAFRFSHRACAGRALELAYEPYRFMPLRADYSDGTTLLWPLVKIRRRVPSLSIASGMPLGLEGRPIPLAGSPESAHLEALFEALDGCGRLAVFGGMGGSPPATGVVSTDSTHSLDLTLGYEEIWAHRFPAKTRNMCRKAERSGLTVARESGEEAVTAYQALYRASASGWGYEEPPYPDGLFASLLACEHAELWLARSENQVVAGAVMLRGSTDLLYWSGAMDREFRHLAPSNALIRAVIEDACGRRLAHLDFGSSRGLSGVEAFKRSFGAELHEYRSVVLMTQRYRHLERAQRKAGRLRLGSRS